MLDTVFAGPSRSNGGRVRDRDASDRHRSSVTCTTPFLAAMAAPSPFAAGDGTDRWTR
jgi:hypothetical protein